MMAQNAGFMIFMKEGKRSILYEELDKSESRFLAGHNKAKRQRCL
jgi:hypothetical protein